jgi:hypothetical protein
MDNPDITYVLSGTGQPPDITVKHETMDIIDELSCKNHENHRYRVIKALKTSDINTVDSHQGHHGHQPKARSLDRGQAGRGPIFMVSNTLRKTHTGNGHQQIFRLPGFNSLGNKTIPTKSLGNGFFE